MTVANLTNYAVQAGVVLLIGLLAPRLLGLRSPAAALRYWQVLLSAVLLLPVLQPWQVGSAGTVSVEAVRVRLSESVQSMVSGSAGVAAAEWVLLGIAAVAAARLIWLVVGLCVLHRLRRGARPLSRLPAAVDDLVLEQHARVRFLVSDRISAPVTFGWRRPAVLVPAGFSDLPEAQQVGIACHELLHVRRRDWIAVMFEQCLSALLWFHPAVPILVRRIELSREQLIDGEVVRLTGRRRHYLDALWAMARQQDRPASTPALFLLNRSDLFERVALLAREVPMSRLRVTTTVFVTVASVAIAGAAAAAAFPFVKPANPGATTSSSSHELPLSKRTEVAAGRGDSGREAIRFERDGEVTEPRVISKVNPVYPEEARKAGLTGVVVCETVLTAEGRISDITILRTADEVFNQPTIDALMQWTFEPATLDGEPVDVIYVLTVKYSLSDDKPKAEENEE